MEVIVYGKPNCQYCDMAKNLLNSKGIVFQYIDVSVDSAAMDKIKNDGARTVPRVYINGVCIGGFTELREKLND